jgi:hypothetical protein
LVAAQALAFASQSSSCAGATLLLPKQISESELQTTSRNKTSALIKPTENATNQEQIKEQLHDI